MTKIILQLYPNHMRIYIPWITHAKFQNDRYKTVRGVALGRSTHCLYIEGVSPQCKKGTKNDQKIISKPHAHPFTMKKSHAKFQTDRYKTVRGVALTRDIYWGWKMTKFTMWKKWQKWSSNYIQTTCTSSYHEKKKKKKKKNMQSFRTIGTKL